MSLQRVALQWAPAPSPAQSVVIVRKVGSAPTSPLDGDAVYFGTNTSFLDQNLPAGATLFYAAFPVVADDTPIEPNVLSFSLPSLSEACAQAVPAANLLHPNAFKSQFLPGIVLGPPAGAGLMAGSLDVVSLGAATNNDNGATAPYGGHIILDFGEPIWNGPGADFTVFENVFYIGGDPERRFMEPAVVSVSQDGQVWHTFPVFFSPRYNPDGTLNLRHPFTYSRGFAGINSVLSNNGWPDPTDPNLSGGDSFDLEELGVEWVRYVRVESTGHLWKLDQYGQPIHHNQETNAANRNSPTSGFDLDAIVRIWIRRVTSP